MDSAASVEISTAPKKRVISAAATDVGLLDGGRGRRTGEMEISQLRILRSAAGRADCRLPRDAFSPGEFTSCYQVAARAPQVVEAELSLSVSSGAFLWTQPHRTPEEESGERNLSTLIG